MFQAMIKAKYKFKYYRGFRVRRRNRGRGRGCPLPPEIAECSLSYNDEYNLQQLQNLCLSDDPSEGGDVTQMEEDHSPKEDYSLKEDNSLKENYSLKKDNSLKEGNSQKEDNFPREEEEVQILKEFGQGQHSEIGELTEEEEIYLFKLLAMDKPLGVNKNLNVLNVTTDFNNLTGRQMNGEDTWKKINELFSPEALEQPLESEEKYLTKQEDFELPDSFDDEKKAHTNTWFGKRRPSRSRVPQNDNESNTSLEPKAGCSKNLM